MTEQEEAELLATHPAFRAVPDSPDLPYVMLVGDSVSVGYTEPVRELLAGRANVHRIPDIEHSTARALAFLPEWLGKRVWDVVHFNWGLHDLSLVRGEPKTRPGLYAVRLRSLVDMLRPRAKALIWASTTPVTRECERFTHLRSQEEPGLPVRLDKHVRRYNKVAARIMEEYGIPINDLYEIALPELASIQRPRNVHFTEEGYQFLAQAVATNIQDDLLKLPTRLRFREGR